ncbi:hypothetical protein BpHYR1_006185, partial [Brachionus plicatilis]
MDFDFQEGEIIGSFLEIFYHCNKLLSFLHSKFRLNELLNHYFYFFNNSCMEFYLSASSMIYIYENLFLYREKKLYDEGEMKSGINENKK